MSAPLSKVTREVLRTTRGNSVLRVQASISPDVASSARILFCHATGFCKEIWNPVIDSLISELQREILFRPFHEQRPRVHA
jgi:hypothetical protein